MDVVRFEDIDPEVMNGARTTVTSAIENTCVNTFLTEHTLYGNGSQMRTIATSVAEQLYDDIYNSTLGLNSFTSAASTDYMLHLKETDYITATAQPRRCSTPSASTLSSTWCSALLPTLRCRTQHVTVQSHSVP